jgi:ketose-bisphosphate aldolase
MSELLAPALAGGYAVPAFAAWDGGAVRAILGVATELRAPVILMHAGVDWGVLPPAEFAKVVRVLAEDCPVPVSVILDHGGSMEEVRACLAAGFTGVMLDYSARPIEENAAALREVVALARPLGVTVEGEIGHVGRVDDSTTEGEKVSTLTTVEDAVAYVEATGVEALAVSIGNAHGRYTVLPTLEFGRLAELHEAIDLPLVLHGGSGTPEADLRRAIGLGIAKVNVATELVTAFRETLSTLWEAGDKRWLTIGLGEATASLRPVAERWFHRTGAAGKA